jgi:hypothetical protein
MLTAWILGSCFFVFVICVVVYVLTIDVSQPDSTQRSRAETISSSEQGPVAARGKYIVSKDYQVVFSPRAFVDYPFGIKVVFAEPGASGPVLWKSAERTGHASSNVRRSFRETEYHGWLDSALEDPELMVIGGRLEFESEEVEPTIRVEVKSSKESFRTIETSEDRVLERDRDAVFSFWLTPLAPEAASLALVIFRVSGRFEPETAGRNGRTGHELTTIALTVPVTFFPIALR